MADRRGKAINNLQLLSPFVQISTRLYSSSSRRLEAPDHALTDIITDKRDKTNHRPVIRLTI